MKKKIMFYVSTMCLLFVTPSCDKLELGPIDYYASGNFWKNAPQVEGYMAGLHTLLRDDHASLVLLGEFRGGTSRWGTTDINTSIDNSSPIKDNDFTKDKTGIANWNGFYKRILNINLFIRNVENECDFLTSAERNYYLGQAYGLRAFYYFLLYRTFGGVPVTKDVEVINKHVSESADLFLPRSTPKETLDFIKDDINKSDTYFGNDYTLKGTRSLWSKAATQVLKGEIYLWSAKVTAGNQSPAATDLQTAKDALTPLIGKFSLQSNFTSVFSSKGNDEIIFALRFREGEATNWGNMFVSAAVGTEGTFTDINGTLLTGNNILGLRGTGVLRHQYKFGLFESYDDSDLRKRQTFFDFYRRNILGIISVKGTIMLKYIGVIDATDNRIYTTDIPVYRYADVLLLLAEIENKLAGGDPSTYINQIRQRAYGSNYSASLHGFVDAGFEANELAILRERDKEFVAEGKRWFDVLRMQDASGRALVFDARTNYDSSAPILNYATEAHKVLWPVDVNTLTSDLLLKQTPGYEEN
jgi:hypothetical protein